MKREIFRKKALKKLSSPEELDKLLPVIKSKGWIALISCIVVIVIALI